MKIAVNGLRSNRSEWEAVQRVPTDQLPRLTLEQRKVAEQLRIREEDYQRSILAGKQTGEKLLKKTEWFARFLQRNLSTRAPEAIVKSVVLDTWKDEFEIAIEIDGTALPLHIAEGIVDDLFDLGAADAEQRLLQMLEGCLHRHGVSSMELNRPVTVFFNEKGQEALQWAAGSRQKSAVASFYAFETDESGLWVSNRREDGEHWLFIPWGCILAMDVPLGGTPVLESAV